MTFPIYKYVRLGKQWRYQPAALDRGVPIKDMVLIDGQMSHHPEGAYYLRQGRAWIKAGKSPQDVIETTLRLCQPEMPVVVKTGLRQQAFEFLEAYNIGKADKTQQAMGLVIKNFLLNCKVETVKDVSKDHVRAYWQYELDHSKTNSRRTAYNRVASLGSFLKEYDVHIIGKGKGKWTIPPFDEETPEVYTDEEIAAITFHSDQRHRAAYSAMLMGLLREKEAVYLTWDRIDLRRGVIHVKSQPQYGFRVKKYHERSVKVPLSPPVF